MALITNFKASFRCPTYCPDGTAWLYSTLGSLGATYGFGDCPGDDIQAIDFEESAFTVRSPKPGEPIHMLMSWTCEHNMDYKHAHFGEVVFENGCGCST